jgi:AraC-like DNA-binding protein
MPVLPVPLIISLILLGFLFQRVVTRETHITVLVLIASCALQGAIIAFVQHYEFVSLRPLQAVMATTIPPVAWIAFMTAAGGELRLPKLGWHLLGPLFALFCLKASADFLDVFIPLTFAGYGLAMLALLWRGEDALLHSRLDGGTASVFAWRIIAVSLIASAICDVAFVYAISMGNRSSALWIPSFVSSLSLLSLGIWSLSQATETRREHSSDFLAEVDIERDQAIIANLDKYLLDLKPFLDPDLTLARLSRKMVVPAKQLSAAINREKNENVSRFINRHRIDYACELMTTGKSVTTAIYDSGFNTKSNFNREFLRLKNMSPREWLAKSKGGL